MKNEPFIHKYLPIPNDKKDYFLRYCPQCIEDDRGHYGECYFHIQHQIPSIHVCHLHNCELVDTAIPNTKRRCCIMMPLEQIIAENGIGKTVENEADNINVRAARYINGVLHQPFDLDARVPIGEYLTVKLKTEYVSPRGEQRNLVELNRDMAIYFNGLRTYGITKQRLANIFRNNSFNPYDILLTAMFEGIAPSDLCSYKGYTEPKHITFDRRVRELREQGKSYEEIGNILCVCHEVIRQVLKGTYDKPKLQGSYSPYRSPKWNWDAIDEKCCIEFDSKVQIYIEGNPNGIISRRVVAELFDLNDKTLRNLPRLKKMIADYRERNNQSNNTY